MRMHVVQPADNGDLGALRDSARAGRAAAMQRRRALAAGRSAVAPAHERVGTEFGEAERRARADAVDATSPAARGRALSMQRRRQLSQGKQALNGGGDRTAAAARVDAPTFIVHRGGAR